MDPRRRWAGTGLVVRVIPLVAAAVLAKLAADRLGWDRVALNSLHAGLVTSNIFLIGFMLAGTLADYKESEKLPGEIAGRIETIADECQILFRDRAAGPARDCLAHLGGLAGAFTAWLRGREPISAVFERIEGLNHFFLAFQPLTQPNFIVRLKQEQSALRLLAIRINTIKETSFVGAGYTVVGVTSVLLVTALVFADIAQLGAELFLLGALTFVLAYSILLIKDMDNPFDYDAKGAGGAVEVSLAPLDHVQQRVARATAMLDEPVS